MKHFTPKYLSSRKAAAVLGVPVAWLESEADAKRIPCLRAGRRRLFDVEAVEAVLDVAAGNDILDAASRLSSAEGGEA